MPTVNPEDLLNATEVAALIGLANPNGISVYRRRYEDFPAPVVEKPPCVLWRRQDVEKWARQNGRLPREGS